jgi:hypothetical protein
MIMPNSIGQAQTLIYLCPFCHWILMRNPNVGYNFAISKYFFIKLSNYISYDNTVVIMPNLYVNVTFDRVMPLFVLGFCYSDKVPDGDTCSTEHPSNLR